MFLISVQNLPTSSNTCPNPTSVNGRITTGNLHILPNGTFPTGEADGVACDGGFTMHVDLGPSPFLILISEEHGIWSRPPPECIPNDQGK